MPAAGSADPVIAHDVDDTVMTGEAVGLELRPTPFVLAAAGAAIDWVVYFIGGTLALTFGVLIPVASSPLGADSAWFSAFLSAGVVLVFIVIPTAVELLSRGKSLGRLAVGARIVRDDGGSIGFRHAFIRNLVAILEIYATLGGLAAIVGLTNDRSKRLGDLLAGTYSQYERTSRIVEPIFGVPAPLVGWAVTADVARIPSRLSLRSTKFLRQAAQLTPSTRSAIARQLAGELAHWVSPVPNVEPELFVAAVVALRRDRELRAHRLESERLARVGSALESLPHSFPKRG
jgi:uncharacterized RDD family membrane protein YckC